MARIQQRSGPEMHKNWVFEVAEPVLDVEVSLLAAPGTTIDIVRGGRRDETVRVVVDRCAALFADTIYGRVEHVRHNNFNHHGLTVHIIIAAPDSERLDNVVSRELSELERSLETTLQSHFGWEQAAVSVQIDPNPAYEARRGRRSAPRSGSPDDINVWQPGGGSNAIAPVIVTVPTAAGGADTPVHALPYPPVKQGSAAVAGLLGALVAVGVAIMVGLIVGPLTGEIGALYEDREVVAREHYNETRLQDQQIQSLRRENGRLHDTVSRLASRRGQPAMRSDQPTRTLPDTEPLGPLAAAPPAASPSTASGAP